MLDVLIALIPAGAFGVYNFGLEALVRIIVSIVACVAIEALYEYLMHMEVTVRDLSAAVTGMLLALNVPVSLPIGMLILGDAFAIIIVKMLFGGLGQNFMNPALGARCFLFISFAKWMTDFTATAGFAAVDGYTGATPLAILKGGEEVAGLAQPALSAMFLGTTAGTIGETSALAILVGGLYLIARKVISPRIPVSYIATFAIFILIFAPGHQFDVQYMLKEICGGGLMLGAFFMATDYVTSPITANGKIVFGICLGLLTGIFRMFGANSEGVSFAIIFCNLLVPHIEKLTIPRSFGKVKPEKEAKKS
jgi:RnfABCDGE-type electron transport complex D subunit